MRLLRSFFASLLLALSVVVVGAAPSFACSCAGGEPEDFVGWADVVMLGTVTDRQGPPWRPVMSSADLATYTVEVETVFKGDVAPTAYIQTADSGASCGLEGIENGDRYVLFADRQDDALRANLCGGSAPATDQLIAAVRTATGGETDPASTATAGEPPPPLGAALAMPAALGSGVVLALLAAVMWVRQLRG